MKINKRRLILLIICAIIACAVIITFVTAGDIKNDMRTQAKDYAMLNNYNETGAKNAVTAIYLNYRLWDTIFEALVLLLSALAVINFSWSGDSGSE